MLKATQLSGFGGARSRGGAGLYWAYSGNAGRASAFSDGRVMVAAGGKSCVVKPAFLREASIAAGVNVYADGADFYAAQSDFSGAEAALYVYKLSSSGGGISITWQKRYAVAGQDIAAIGTSPGTVPQMVADATHLYVPFLHGPVGGGDLFGIGVLKVAKADGTAAWAYRYDSASYGNPIALYGLAIPASGGGVIFSGYWNAGSNYGFISKLDSAGARAWHVTTTGGVVAGCAVDPSSGDIYAGQESALIKLPSTGASVTWGRTLGAGALDIAVDGSGNVWTGGSTVYAYDSSGTLISARTLSTSVRLSLAGSDLLLTGGVASNGFVMRTPQRDAGYGARRVGVASTLSYDRATASASSSVPTLGAVEPPTKGLLTIVTTTPSNSFAASAPTAEGFWL